MKWSEKKLALFAKAKDFMSSKSKNCNLITMIKQVLTKNDFYTESIFDLLSIYVQNIFNIEF